MADMNLEEEARDFRDSTDESDLSDVEKLSTILLWYKSHIGGAMSGGQVETATRLNQDAREYVIARPQVALKAMDAEPIFLLILFYGLTRYKLEEYAASHDGEEPPKVVNPETLVTEDVEKASTDEPVDPDRAQDLTDVIERNIRKTDGGGVEEYDSGRVYPKDYFSEGDTLQFAVSGSPEKNKMDYNFTYRTTQLNNSELKLGTIMDISPDRYNPNAPVRIIHVVFEEINYETDFMMNIVPAD
jgi:hypothetical protein